MRIKNSIINAFSSLISSIIVFIPNILTRKVFIENLGNDMLGLLSLYSNIIGWLSIFELGFGAVISSVLYKPYYEKKYDKVNSYINIYKKIYISIGFLILSIGIIISPMIKYLIAYQSIDEHIIIAGMILYVINTFISYIFSAKLCLFNLSQENYKLTFITMISRLVICILQYISLKRYPNIIIYILISIFINLIYYISTNIYLSKKYSWLVKNKCFLNDNEKKELIRNVSSTFLHKIGSLVVFNTDNIIISKFVGLISLSKYSNYQMIVTTIQGLINSIMNGAISSLGSLVATESNIKCYDVHKKMFFVNFWISSMVLILLYNTLNQFICIWLGSDYVIHRYEFDLLILNSYIYSMRLSIGQFQSVGGLFYKDRYAPIVESFINLFLSLILVKNMGITGVLLGTLASNLLVVFWVKPYIVYRYIFKKNVKEYFEYYIMYSLIGFITLFITNRICTESYFLNGHTFFNLIASCIFNIISINIVYIFIFYKTNEFKYLVKLLYNYINSYFLNR